MLSFSKLSTVGSYSADTWRNLEAYWKLLLRASEMQNLTSDLDPEIFQQKHIRDVIELKKSGLVSFPAMDLGSGAGIPGLLSAILHPDEAWTLCESERRKAEFLLSAVEALGLQSRVEVFPGRAEELLKTRSFDTICVRAVGSIEKVFEFIRKRSTWNTLVLFKGAKWAAEFQDFISKKHLSKHLVLSGDHEYQLSGGDPIRRIVRFSRVPPPKSE